MGQRAGEIRALGADLLAVAVTATFSQQAFAKSMGVDFPLLSDWGGEVSDAYGVRYDVWKGHTGVAKRSWFVIDTDRVVRFSWVTDDALELPVLEDIVAAVKELGRSPG